MLRYPEKNNRAVDSLNKAIAELRRWIYLPEEEKYAEWSAYYVNALSYMYATKSERSQERARYEGMLSQVYAVNAPSRLQNFKDFMIEQLNSSIEFDCNLDDKYYSPSEYVEWCKNKTDAVSRDVKYCERRRDEEIERYNSQIEYINLMAETFGFEVEK